MGVRKGGEWLPWEKLLDWVGSAKGAVPETGADPDL